MYVPPPIESSYTMREFLFHPLSDNLSLNEKVVSLIANIALTVFSLGTYAFVFFGVNAYDYWTESTPRDVVQLHQNKSKKMDLFKEYEKDLPFGVSDRRITETELAKHTQRNDLWIAISGLVFNLSPFLDDHPAGEDILLVNAGTDATQEFMKIGHTPYAHRMAMQYCIGRLV